MRHIIFGGNGFLGRVLAKKLIENDEHVVVADIEKSKCPHYDQCDYLHIDVSNPKDFWQIELKPDDLVYNLAAVMLYPVILRDLRKRAYTAVNANGTKNILKAMEKGGAHQLIHLSSDFIYGHTKTVPIFEDHPIQPLGEYSASKWQAERYIAKWRKEKGFNATIFRPRMIIGPGRIGAIEKIFKLINHNLPVPIIGNGKNLFQFISVYDCVEALLCAWKAGVPNEAYNLSSSNTPTIRALLKQLIKQANSKSIIIPIPVLVARYGMQFLDFMDAPIMDPEQYLTVNENCIFDCAKANRELNWESQFVDIDSLAESFFEYQLNNPNNQVETISTAPCSGSTH